MDSLPTWALWITAGVTGFGLGLAFLMVGAIGGFLQRTVWPLSIGVPQLGPKQARDEAAIAVPLG